jgi:adenine-specific DNA-methyltransferase
MASMFGERPAALRVLDAGAGVGSLSAALVAQVSQWVKPPKEVSIVAYEVEPLLVDYLLKTLDECGVVCRRAGIRFSGEVRAEDFIGAAVGSLQGRELFPGDRPSVNAAILNPPYRKLNSESESWTHWLHNLPSRIRG